MKHLILLLTTFVAVAAPAQDIVNPLAPQDTVLTADSLDMKSTPTETIATFGPQNLVACQKPTPSVRREGGEQGRSWPSRRPRSHRLADRGSSQLTLRSPVLRPPTAVELRQRIERLEGEVAQW